MCTDPTQHATSVLRRLAELRQAVERVADVPESDESQHGETDEEGEDPEQERTVPDVGAVVLNALACYFSSIDFAMAARNSLFVLVLPRRCSRSSVPSIWPTAESIFRRRMTCRMTSGARSISSRRVPDAGMLMAGKVRRS